MDVLTYVLASPWTQVAGFVAGWLSGLGSAAVIARVNQR